MEREVLKSSLITYPKNESAVILGFEEDNGNLLQHEAYATPERAPGMLDESKQLSNEAILFFIGLTKTQKILSVKNLYPNITILRFHPKLGCLVTNRVHRRNNTYLGEHNNVANGIKLSHRIAIL